MICLFLCSLLHVIGTLGQADIYLMKKGAENSILAPLTCRSGYCNGGKLPIRSYLASGGPFRQATALPSQPSPSLFPLALFATLGDAAAGLVRGRGPSAQGGWKGRALQAALGTSFALLSEVLGSNEVLSAWPARTSSLAIYTYIYIYTLHIGIWGFHALPNRCCYTFRWQSCRHFGASVFKWYRTKSSRRC